MTITNTTIGIVNNTDHFLEVTLNNGSHSIITEPHLAPGIGVVSFTNWSSWEPIINAAPEAYFDDVGYLNHTLTQDYAEYGVEYWLQSVFNTTLTLYIQFTIVYDVTTGVYVRQGMQTYNFDQVGLGLGLDDIEFETSRLGYVKPPPPSSSTTTTTTTSSSVAPPTSNTTTTSATSTVTTTTTTTTIPPPTSSTSTVTTTTDTATTSTTVSDSTVTVTTTVSDTNTATVTNTVTNTTTTTTTTTSTTDSTQDTNTTEETTAEPPISDEVTSSDANPTLPGFTAIISFTAFIAIFTVIRYRKY